MQGIQILHFLIASVLVVLYSSTIRVPNSGFRADAETAAYVQRNRIQSLFEVKAQLEFWRVLKGNKKSFCHNSKRKRLKKETVGLFLNEANDLVTLERGKAMVPRAIFASDLPLGSLSSLCLGFKEENCHQWVRIKLGITWENLTHKHA